MNNKSVLFISHEASRTGAPIILLNLLEWLKNNSDLKFNLLINNNEGPNDALRGEFEKLCDVFIYNDKSHIKVTGPITNAINYYLSRFITRKVHFKRLKKHFENQNIGLVYSNTIVNARVLEFLSFLKCPVISHVHELDYSISYMIGNRNLEIIKKYTTRYIAAAQAVKDSLVNHYDIPDQKIDLVYEFTDLKNRGKTSYTKRDLILKELNLTEDAIIVGASGTIQWRKGPDLFIQLARAVYKRKPKVPIHFIWVGGETKGINYINLEYDIKKTGLENYIHFIGERNNPFNYFKIFDIFTLLSREDPFPLVVLENASLGKPILCFDNSGGAKEFVGNDSGFVVPYLDIEAMAEKVLELHDNNELRKKLGQNGAEKMEKQYNFERGTKKILDTIERIM